jgi:hypothetical protein
MSSQFANKSSKSKSMLYEIDLFSENIIFTFNGESTLKTKAGVFATLLLISIGIFMFFFMGQSFFFKKDPLSIYSSKVLDKANFLDTSTDKRMFLAFRIRTTKNLTLDGKYFNVVATIFRPNKGSVTFNTPISLIECEKMSGLNKTYLENLGLLRNNFYCISLLSPAFGGDLRDLEYNFIQVSILACTSANTGCNAIVANSLNTANTAVYLDTYYPQIFYNPNEYEGGFRIQHIPITDKYQYQAVVDRELYFKQSLFNDDRGWLLKDIKKTLLYSVHNTAAYRGPKPTGDMNLFRTVIYVSGMYEEYTRTYQKLQDVIAVVGGFIGICRIVLRMLLFAHIKYTKSEYLLNDLIKFRRPGSNGLFAAKNDIKSILQESPVKLSINKFTTNNNALSNNNIREEEKDNSQLELNEIPSKLISNGKQLSSMNNIKFQLSNCEIIKKTLCKRCLKGKSVKRVEIFDLTYTYIKDTLDISKYFDAIFELKNIKTALFNTSQKKSFAFQEKPTVVINDLDDKTLKEIETVLFEKSANTVSDERTRLVEYFSYRLYNKTATSVDNKIIELLDSETASMIVKRLNDIKSAALKGKSPIFEHTLLNADDN